MVSRLRMIIVNLAMVIGLNGCVSISPYEVPKSSDVASLRIETSQNDNNIYVLRYLGDIDGYKCSKKPTQLIAMLNNVSVIDKYLDKGVNQKGVNIQVKANEEFRFNIDTTFLNETDRSLSEVTYKYSMCKAHVSFIPKKGKNYVAKNYYSNGVCKTDIYERSLDGLVKVTDIREYPFCYDDEYMHDKWKEELKAE